MKRGAQAAFALSVLFFGFFVFGITDMGQVVLRGRIPPNASHWQLDDIYMGAGLAPWVYGLAPAVLLALIGWVLSCRLSTLLEFRRLAALSIGIAIAAWLVDYVYLVKIAGLSPTGFFSSKVVIGLFAVSFGICVIFRWRGFFRPR